mmetsp:Transcript_4555/g.8308  ORF Transcript_4555/g.8308 Transcript_4555/m.8308 type:complete len:225 (+) Transcript_4555:179-853(+)
MSAKAMHITSLSLLVVTTVLVIVAFSGTNGDSGVPWAKTVINFRNTECQSQELYGLKNFRQSYKNCVGQNDETIKYDSDKCDDSDTDNSQYCSKCSGAGKTVISMFSIALALICVSAVLIVMRLNDTNSGSDSGCTGKRLLVTLTLGGLTAVLAIAFATWSGDCFNALVKATKHLSDKNFVDQTTAQLMGGFAVTVVACFTAGVATLIEFFTSQSASASENEAK